MSKIDIKAMIKDLKKNELTELISVAQEVLSTLFNSSEIRDNVKESRFSKGYECPKCQCKDVNKNGKSNGRQRYICKRCRTSFDEFTMSPFSNTKLGLDKWIKYCELMILGLSIRKCAEEVGVGVKTSFYMRHRILDVINLSLKNDKVEGIVEVDECFIKESFKGNHSKSTTFVMPRNPRKRGKGKNDKKKRGISKEQICIETAIDRKGNILMSAVCNGRITTNQIINFFDNKICEDATFCVDSHKSYMAIKDKLNIELKQVPRGKSMIDSVYHLQHINALHSSFISGTIIEKNAKVGDALSTGSDLCTIYDLSYLEMTINVDELQVSSLKVGQSVQVTADAVKDKTYEGLVTRVSMKGDTSGGTTTYPVTVRIDETDGLRPGMNANAEIVVAQAKNALTVPNAAIVRGGYVLVRQDSPSAVNADDSMSAPEGYVYVKVKTGVSDDNYTQVTSGLSESDTIAYDPSSVSSDSYYDDGGYDDMGGEVIGGAGNNADLAEGGEETLPEETENGEAPAADAEEPAEGIDPAEAGAVVVD